MAEIRYVQAENGRRGTISLSKPSVHLFLYNRLQNIPEILIQLFRIVF